MPGLSLCPGVELGSPGDVGTRLDIRPGSGVQAVADRRRHQLMPGRVELDLVEPVPVPVVGAQDRFIRVSEPCLLDHLGRACELAELVQFRKNPARAVLSDRGQQGLVGRDVVPGQGRRLVDDLVGQVWMPHSVLAEPAQRPLRGSAPASTRAVQVWQPIDG